MVDQLKDQKKVNGVYVLTVDSKMHNCEYKVNSIFYVLTLWLVSILAIISNSGKIFLFMLKNKLGYSEALWKIGRSENHISSFFVDKFSSYNHQAKYGAAGWKSLRLFYNYETEVLPRIANPKTFREVIEAFLTKFWIGKMENRQAVANRLKIVVDLLANTFRNIEEKEIRIVSVASGSAQAVIEAIKKCPELKFRVILIDNDESAIAEAKKNVKMASLDCFEFILGTTSCLEDACQRINPQIIEMVGFLDYRPQAKAKKLIGRIYDCLPEKGYFLTCNIKNNRERIFLPGVLLWPMIYRTVDQFVDVVIGGKFSPKKTIVYYEPHKIHGIAYCQK